MRWVVGGPVSGPWVAGRRRRGLSVSTRPFLGAALLWEYPWPVGLQELHQERAGADS